MPKNPPDERYLEGLAPHMYEMFRNEVIKIPLSAQMDLIEAFSSEQSWESLPQNLKALFRTVNLRFILLVAEHDKKHK